MKKKCYISCQLYSISDDFRIEDNFSYKECVFKDKKKYVDDIIVKEYFGVLAEVLTGVLFDFTEIEISEYYSKLLKRYIPKQKKHRSSEPIHVSLYSEDSMINYRKSCNYEYVCEDEIKSYRDSVILKYGTIENYRKYLLYLKKNANDILENAINEFENQKSLKKVKR